jgi:hypothetical protein
MNLKKAVELIQEEMKKEFGEDSKLEDGDTIVGIFKDCVIKLEKEDNEIKIDITLGEPYTFDFNVFEEKG